MLSRRGAVRFLGAGGLGVAALGFTGMSNRSLAHVTPAPSRRGLGNAWLAYDTMIDQARADWRVPGMAVAIVRDGALVYAKGSGVANVDTARPVTGNTLFNVGSTTKAITAAGIAMLVDQNKLDWDAPVTTYLPSFRLGYGDEYASVSLRDMMSHRTGLGRHDLLWYNNKALTLEALLARLPYLETYAPLRSSYQYNNIMVMLAGLAIERVTGMSWEAYTKTALFEPLGMTRSHLSVEDMGRDGDFANGHRLRDGRTAFSIPLRPEDRIGPAGGVNSSVNDYAKWIVLQLGRGTAEGRQFFSSRQASAMWEPFVMAGGVPSNAALSRGYYGLGWRIDTYRGMARVAHGGNLNGFSSRVTLFPEKNMGIVAFANMGASPVPGHLSLDLADMMLGLKPANWSAINLARRDASQAEGAPVPETRRSQVAATTPSRALSAFIGRYHHKGYGDYFVEIGPAGLRARYNDMPMALAHWHYDVFNAVPDRGEDSDLGNIKFSFASDVEGQIASVSAKMDESTEPVVFVRMRA